MFELDAILLDVAYFGIYTLGGFLLLCCALFLLLTFIDLLVSVMQIIRS